jgi:hypothetical protein
MAQQPVSHLRRFTSRVQTPNDVWVDWRCAGCEDISRVWNLSLGGCLSRHKSQGVRVQRPSLNFLSMRDRLGPTQLYGVQNPVEDWQ